MAEAAREQMMATICTEDERLSPARDLGLVLRKHHEFSEKALAQANYLITTPSFRTWLLGVESGMLLVDGHCGDQSMGRIGPTSVFCAGLIDTLSDSAVSTSAPSFLPTRSSIVLYFFAGQHTNNAHGLTGPYGMIRSLADQLLLQWPDEDTSQLRFLERLLPLIYSTDNIVGLLCQIFEQLVVNLSSRVSVYCIIDGVSSFETSLYGWVDELDEIFDYFLQCMVQTSGYSTRAAIKFLLVSADKSTSLWRRVPENCHVDLRAGNFHSPFMDQRDLGFYTGDREY